MTQLIHTLILIYGFATAEFTTAAPDVLQEEKPLVITGELVQRGVRFFQPGSETPFTGVLLTRHKNGKKAKQTTYKAGLRHGKATDWYENGNKMQEMSFKNNLVDGKMISY